MSTTVLLGCQWGDEGKASVIDFLAQNMDYVVRFQGGGNAGHTIVHEGRKTVLHYIPSGILNPKTICVIGNGVIVNLEELKLEKESLEQKGIDLSNRFFISDRTHLVLPCHPVLDAAREDRIPNQMIGTTRRGIAPTYSDKALRINLRIGDLFESRFTDRITEVLREKNFLLSHYYHLPEIQIQKTLDSFAHLKEYFTPYIKDTVTLLHQAIREHKEILLEGAQGTLLDLDFGSYPYVTSSNTSAGGACIGTGIAPNQLDYIYGLFKCYITRVGEGPFPTEIHGEEANQIRTWGNEFGSTTGRPRRIGWFDLVLAKFAIQINGLTHFILTKIDILDSLDTIPICTGYEMENPTPKCIPTGIDYQEHVKPIYAYLPGWKSSTVGAKHLHQLPTNARSFIEYIETHLNVPLIGVSTGADRNDIIWAPSSN